MDHIEVLLTGVEISIAFAGFSGIVASFQLRNGGTIHRGDMVGLMIIVQTSLLSAMTCGVALVLFSFNIDEQTVWSIISGIAATWTAWISYLVYKNLRGFGKKRSSRLFVRALQFVYVMFIVALALNAFGIVFDREFGPFLAGYAAGMSLVGLMFLRLLLRPLWRMLHEQEAAQ